MALLKGLHDNDHRFKALSLSRNFGKEIASAAGLTYATGDAAVLMDADLQHPPELIKEFVAHWRDGFDIVYGQRIDRDADSCVSTAVGARAFYAAFQKLSGTALPQGAGDFRLLDRKAIDAMNRMRERVRFNKGLYAWMGFRVGRRAFPGAATQQRRLALAAAPAPALRTGWHNVLHDDPAARVVLPRPDRVAVCVRATLWPCFWSRH